MGRVDAAFLCSGDEGVRDDLVLRVCGDGVFDVLVGWFDPFPVRL